MPVTYVRSCEKTFVFIEISHIENSVNSNIFIVQYTVKPVYKDHSRKPERKCGLNEQFSLYIQVKIICTTCIH